VILVQAVMSMFLPLMVSAASGYGGVHICILFAFSMNLYSPVNAML
jgi:hypothetical protein